MMSEELKPCPFCKHTKTKIYRSLNEDKYIVECTRCGCRTGTCYGEQNAIIVWNTRPIEDALREELERTQRREVYKRLAHYRVKLEQAQAKIDAMLPVVEAARQFVYQVCTHGDIDSAGKELFDLVTDKEKGGEE